MSSYFNFNYGDYNTPILWATVSSAYIIYYTLRIAHKPRVFCSTKFYNFLRNEMPVLEEIYKPTFWSFGAIPQTLLRTVLKSKPAIQYKKQFFSLRDGGHVALDWVHNDESTQYPDPDTRPTVLLLPGLIGSSAESYMLHFVQQSYELGYRSVVFNNRGNGGAELKTPRTYCAANTEDLREVIEYLHKTLPKSPVVGAGVSLGGIILSNYLSHTGKDSGLCAAFTVSMAWNLSESTKTLEEPVNHFLFNSYLCQGLKDNIQKYRHFFEDYDLEYLMKSTRIRDFDDRFVARQFGYASWKEYYAAATMHMRLDEVKTPLLALNAGDDPFAPEHTLPCKAAEQSSHVALVVTKHGGHIGFLEGMIPTSTGYVDRVFAQYIRAAFENRDTICAMLDKHDIKQSGLSRDL